MRLFHFLTWIRRLKARVFNRQLQRESRRPVRRADAEQRPTQHKPELRVLEQRESFGDVSLLGLTTAAGAAGAAGFLFGAAALMLREPRVEQSFVDDALVGAGTTLDPLTAGLLDETLPAGLFQATATWTPSGAATDHSALDEFFADGDAEATSDAASAGAASASAADWGEAGLQGGALDAALAALEQPLAAPADDALTGDPDLPALLAGGGAGFSAAASTAPASSSPAIVPGTPLESSFPTDPAYGNTPGTDVFTPPPAPEAPPAPPPDLGPAPAPLPDLGAQALFFEANQGQVGNDQVEFFARGDAYTLFLSATEANFVLHGNGNGTESADAAPGVLRMQYVGANSDAAFVAEDQLSGVTNYLVGDQSAWLTGVANYGAVRQDDVYAGIDLRYYANAQQQLEYDFIVGAGSGADVAAIRLAFSGATGIELDAQGNLVLHTAQGNLVQQAPIVYQEVDGARQSVTGRYVIHDDQSVGFEVGAYNAAADLIIDPVVFSTYHGGSGSQDFGNSIAVDSAGNSYLGGTTNSSNFPTLGAYDGTLSGSHDAFVSKFDAQGRRVYSTYLGGSGLDQGFGIKVDGSGQVYLAGATGSSNFPTTGSAYDSTKNANDDVFLTKLNAAGTGLLYSTYYGGAGTDQGWALAIDGAGMAYLTGLTTSSDLPASGSYQGAQDTFVAAFDTTQSGAASLAWATYLGGSAIELGRGIAVDGSGNVTVGGYTESTGLGTTGAFQDTKSGGRDGFLAQLDNTGSLVYWTYLGGSSTDEVHSLALDAAGAVYATGLTSSTNFPTLNPLQTDQSGQDAFVTKLTADGSTLEYSTYYGGGGTDVGTTIAVDALGQAHVIGKTTSSNLLLARAAQWVYGGTEDAFVIKLDCHGNALRFGTYWGGSAKDQGCSLALDAEGGMVVSGITASTNLPTVAPAQGSLASADDVWVAKFADPVSVVLQPDPYQTDWLALGGLAYVNLLDGAFRKEVPVQTDQSPNLPVGSGSGNNTPHPVVGSTPGSASQALLGDHNLVYNSATVDPRPIIVSTVYLRCDDPTPTQIDVTLTWDGVTQSTQTFTVPGSLNGPYLVAVQAPSTTGGWATGLYSWSVDVTYTLPDTTVVAAGTTTGSAIVVNRSASEIGAGWSVAGASNAVVAVNDGNGNTGAIMIDGRTSYARFFRTGTGGAFVSPANDFGTLVQHGDGSFTYTAKDKTVFRYNAAGLITEFEDTHGLKTLYGRNGSGQLTTLTLADGAVSTWSYSGGLLSSITMPLGTLTVVSRDGDGNPTDIQLTDGEHWTATYATPSGFSAPLMRFDPWGPLAATVTFDSGGRITTFDRGLGSVHNITPQGVQALGSTARAAADNVATVNQPMSGSVSRTNTYTLDAQGRTTQRVNPDATARRLDYDFAGNLARFTDEASRTTTYSYAYGANKGDLTRITRPDGTAVNFAYETTFHHITEYTDSLGRKTTWTFDPVTGDLLTETDPLGQTTTYTYYDNVGVSNGLVESITNPRGFTTTYLYDASRRPTETIDALNHRTTFTYDAAGNIQTVQDALGRVTTAAYDGLRRQILEIDAFGKSTTYTYNAIGQLTSMVDRLGRTTSLVYDQRGWLTSVTEALATAEQRTTSYLYDFVGNLLTLTDPRGVATSFAYDTRDRLVQRIDAFSAPTNLPGLGHASPVTTFAYDAVSNLLSITNPRGFVTSFAYDVRDRQTRVIEAFGNVDQRTVTTAYDAESNVLAVTDGRGVKTSFTYDVLNRLATRIDAATVPGGLPALNHASPVTTYNYDANDNLLSVTDPRGVTTSFAYDAIDRRTRMIEAFATPTNLPGLNHASPVWTYVYDAVDNLLSVTDARGVTTSYAYDVLNRRTAIHEAFNAPTSLPGLNHAPPVTTFVFDAVGNVLSLTDARGVTTSFAYDNLDRRVRTIEAFAAPTALPGLNHAPPVTTYAYDANDNVVGITDARGVGTSLSYDALNRLAVRTDAASAPTALPGLNHASPVTTFAYDIGSNLLSVTDARGVTTSFAYDALDRRVRRIDAFSAPTNLPGLNHASPVWTYVFDKADNLLSVTDPRGVRTSYAYDALNRLAKVVEADAQPGGLAALNHGKPTTTFVYDIGSNLLSVVDPRGVTTSFSYDALNRRVNVIEAFSAPTDLPGLNHAAPTSTFVYDQVGNQLSMTNARGVTTSFAYDALNRLATVIAAFSAPTSLPGLNHASPVSTFVYDAVGNQLSTTDPRGVTTSFAYDALNRLTQIFEAFSAPTGLPGLNHAPPVTTLVYDQVGNQLSLTDARGVTTSFAYDALNRLATSIEAFAAPTTLPGLNHAAPVTTRVYDIASNLLSVTDARNVTTSFAYDALNRVARRIDAFSAPTNLPGLNHASPVTTYLYDIASNLLSVTDPRGVVTSYAYDALNRVARVRDAHSAPTNLPALNHAVPVTSFIYDIGSNLLSVTDPRGVTTSFAYDALNRVSRRIDAFSAPTNLPGLNHASPVTTFVYDAESNLLSVTDPRAVTTSFAYDALNRRTTVIEAFSAPTALPGLNHASPVWTSVYDIASNLLSTTDARGVTTSFAYDALNRLAVRIDAFSAPTALPGLNHASPVTTFVYDAVSNVLSTTDPRGVTTSFAYDALNRLAVQIAAFSAPTALPGLGHASPVTTFVYDAVSNLLSTSDPRGVVTSFAYDALNRLAVRIDAFSAPTALPGLN
ncbi:MAG: SBBP repeat-containing protein, partial [Planctomycetia bacterium]|nr:SBBP repeat-containing protein [Planctomycetia bacterium]